MAKKRSKFARTLDKLVNRKNKDGTLKYSAKEVACLRSMLLLEIARLGRTEDLSETSKAELVFTFHAIGIENHTEPDQIYPLVEKYYRGLGIKSELIAEFWDMLGLLQKQKDRVEAINDTSKAYAKMTEAEGPKAPKEDDPVPEDAENAQTMTLNLGGKVRI